MLLSLRNVIQEFAQKKSFWGSPVENLRAVDGVSLEVDRGEIVGLVGESGCGKSTLARGALALVPFTQGSVFWNGEEIGSMAPEALRAKRKDFQMVFQNPQTALNPRHRIRKILVEPLEVQGVLTEKDREKTAAQMLEQVGLSAADLSKYPHEFSGGQRQRVGLARAMMCRPQLIVLDEPVSSLDVSVQASILNLLVKLNQEARTAYFFISHDLNVVGYLSQRLLVMYLGRIVESGRTDQVLGAPQHPYTRALLQSGRSPSQAIRGEAPGRLASVPGCAFYSRCPQAETRCQAQDQVLAERSPGWKVACWKAS
ncbi:MAG TPA: ABC transporter ATP-binding protein [bacterium]|nr:ABC transporter ATP-binding protein [bacterium]